MATVMAGERLFRQRAILVLLGVFIFVTLLSLGTGMHPSFRSLTDVDDVIDLDVSFSPSADLDKTMGLPSSTPSASDAEDSDEPEDEDLVPVNLRPTADEDFIPKEFDPPSAEMEAKIKKNARKNVIKRKGQKPREEFILLTAVVNSGMADYTLNWIESLKRTKQDDTFLVFAIDQELVDILTEHGYGDNVVLIPGDWFHQKLSAGFSKWEDKSYGPITHAKSLVVERLMYMDITVWFSDVDIVFLSPSIYEYLLMKMNSPRKKTTEMLFSQETEEEILNSGFYIMRPTITSKRVLADSIHIQDTEQVTQQRAINRIIDDLDLNYQHSKVATLDLSLFPHGRMYFERNVPTKYGMDPMMVHANYRVGDNKRISLQKADLWYI
ncbi:hypothetical protein DM01DRAFT_1335796 [Hesseltinella vesiculosa]|uniref:Nucleotide-diphospho-sugar transferase domain-containing protein n=1 Tax=Hesseltinella vesiculosa TaxID=101127 RepID=A0A1X2GHF4_9FUNG|nr:hypothetical protein DM01DRAFT_1335796 [Hesseltinella vesiculosa]